MKLNMNSFSSYLEHLKKDNDVTDVKNDEDQNPFVDKEEKKEKRKKYLSKDKITNSHVIEMQETNVSHSRSVTVENDDTIAVKPTNRKLSILDFGNFLNPKKNSDGNDIPPTDTNHEHVDEEYGVLKKSKFIQSLE